MRQNSIETTWENEQELELAYEMAIKPYECQIKALASKIMKDLDAAKLNEWARLETLKIASKKVEDALGTLVDPGLVDVKKEDERLEKLYWEAYENSCIEREATGIINSIGYKFRNYTEDQIREIVAAAEHYW